MRLSINIDHVATLRNARGEQEPDPVEAARVAERAGADGIVCHLREDRRHIRDRDVERLRKSVGTRLDLEMAATPEIIAIALRVKPDLVTLVPERRRELTTEGGLDVLRMRGSLAKVIERFHAKNIPVSLFVDPHPKQLKASVEIGSDMVELHTGEYANARTDQARRKQLQAIQTIAGLGRTMGLGINAGHGLNYANISAVAAIPDIDEVSIGHAIIARALVVGLENAVGEMVRLVKARSKRRDLQPGR